MKSIVLGAALAATAIPQLLSSLLSPPLPLPSCRQCLLPVPHPDAASGSRPSPGIVGGTSRPGVSPGMSPPAQPPGLSRADVEQSQASPRDARSGLVPASPQSSLAPLTCSPRGLESPAGSTEPGLRPAALLQHPRNSFGGSPEASSHGTGAVLRRRAPAYCTASIPI